MPPQSFGAGAGAGLFQTALNFVSDVGQQFVGQEFWQKRFDQTQEGQKELYEYAHDYTAEMNRLARAGLNPNLVYGQMSGSSPMPGSTTAPLGSSNFTTADIAQTAANLSHAQALDADASLKNAEAGYYNKLSNRYDDIINMALQKESAEINNLAVQNNVGRADIRYKDSLSLLNQAQREYVKGEIESQDYQRRVLAAQSVLFMSQAHHLDQETLILKSEAVMAELEAKYMQYFYPSDMSISNMADAEYQAQVNKFRLEAERAGASIGIEGNEFVKWFDWILGALGQLLGGARNAGQAYSNFRPRKLK